MIYAIPCYVTQCRYHRCKSEQFVNGSRGIRHFVSVSKARTSRPSYDSIDFFLQLAFHCRIVKQNVKKGI